MTNKLRTCASRQEIERHGVIRNVHRIEQWHNKDARTYGHALSLVQEIAKHRDGREHLHRMRKIVMRHPHG